MFSNTLVARNLIQKAALFFPLVDSARHTENKSLAEILKHSYHMSDYNGVV